MLNDATRELAAVRSRTATTSANLMAGTDKRSTSTPSVTMVDGAISFATGALVAVQFAGIPLNLAVVDVPLLYILLFALTRGARVNNIFRNALPWLWLIVLGSFIGMIFALDALPAAVQLGRDVYAFLIFFAVSCWIWCKPWTLKPMLLGLIFIGLVCSALLVAAGDLRPSGTFLNPNYAGHFLAILIMLVAGLAPVVGRRYLVVIPFYLLGMLEAASFGAVVMLAVGLTSFVWWRARALQFGPRVMARAFLVAAVAWVSLSGVVEDALLSQQAANLGLGVNRFDKSSEGRIDRYKTGLELAQEHPLGVGPGQARYFDVRLGDHELHNDYLAYLVERGPVGFVGLVGLLLALWRSMPRAGLARTLLLMVIVGCLVRETLNYRHIWLMLAIAINFDWGVSGLRKETGQIVLERS